MDTSEQAILRLQREFETVTVILLPHCLEPLRETLSIAMLTARTDFRAASYRTFRHFVIQSNRLLRARRLQELLRMRSSKLNQLQKWPHVPDSRVSGLTHG